MHFVCVGAKIRNNKYNFSWLLTSYCKNVDSWRYIWLKWKSSDAFILQGTDHIKQWFSLIKTLHVFYLSSLQTRKRLRERHSFHIHTLLYCIRLHMSLEISYSNVCVSPDNHRNLPWCNVSHRRTHNVTVFSHLRWIPLEWHFRVRSRYFHGHWPKRSVSIQHVSILPL